MTEKMTKIISKQGGNYSISLEIEKFNTPDASSLTTRPKHDRKYNIKIRQEDLILLDALASQKNIPRSVLINNFLHEILLNELLNIKEKDVKLLIAQAADNLAHYDELSCPWVLNTIENECQRIIENIKDYNRAELEVQDEPNTPSDYSSNSETYSTLKEILEGMEK